MMVIPFARSSSIDFLQPFAFQKTNEQQNRRHLRAFPAVCSEEEVDSVVVHFGLREEVRIDRLADGGRAVCCKTNELSCVTCGRVS